MRYLLVIALSVVSLGLSAQRKEKPIQEDLAALRPHFTPPPDTAHHYSGNPVHNVPVVTPHLTVTKELNVVLDSIAHLNLLRKVIPGYTIQVYSGLNREESGNTRRRLQEELDMRANMQYVQPKWRVWVGQYFTTLDAQKDLVRVRRSFPNAILVPENILIR